MGPNWDDDLSGTPDYARNDPNLHNISEEEKEVMFQLEKWHCFIFPEFATIASTRHVLPLARQAQFINEGKMVWYLLTRKYAVHGECALPPALIKNLITTGIPANQKNVFSVILV